MPETYPTENDVSYFFHYQKKEKARYRNRKLHSRTADWDSEIMFPGEDFDVDNDGGYGPEEKAPYQDLKYGDADEDAVEFVDNEEDLYKD